MPRRFALALALAFTTIVTFVIVAVGWNGGLFGAGGGDASDGASASADDVAGALQYLAAISAPEPEQAAAPATLSPRVFTEYVYLYEDQPAPIGAIAAPPSSAAVTGISPSPAAAQPAGEEAPTSTPIARTPPAAPEPTEPPGAPTQPASTQQTLRKELEFTGTVTSIAGDQVTWSYNDGSVTTRVTDELDELSVGTRAKVHALLVSSGYVAKEIELND